MTQRDIQDERLRRDLDALGRLRPDATEFEMPATLDAAILERARRAVRPPAPARRWWIPASVAATALLAVSLVLQVQREATPPPPAAEGSAARTNAADAAMSAPAPEVAAEPVQESPAGVAEFSAELAPATAPAANAAPPAALQEPAPPAARAGSPQAESAKSRAAEVSARAAPPAALPAVDAAASREEALADQAVGPSNAIAAAPEAPLSPEEWLTRIEALESAGRHDEAAAERQRLEAAYPGWLADHAARTK